jgi:hypothetical protein
MTKARRPDVDEAPVDLSDAARAVVRDPGDPRIDAHLAALGLTEGDAPGTRGRARAESPDRVEVAELRRRIGALEAQLEASRARTRGLTIAGAAGVAVIVLLALILVLR